MFFVVFLLLTALDGIQVALSNTSDLLYEGIDRISQQYGIIVPEGLHSQMNNTYQIVFDLSFCFLVVPMAVTMFMLNQLFDGKGLLFGFDPLRTKY